MRLIVKPKEQFRGDALRLVQEKVIKKFNAKDIKVKNGSVVVECQSVQDSENIIKALQTESSNIESAKTFEKNNPKLIITNIITDSAEVHKVELQEDIISRNDLPPNGVTVLHSINKEIKILVH